MIPPRQIPAPLPVVGLIRNQIEKSGVDQTDQCKQSDPDKGISNLPIVILLLLMLELMARAGKVKMGEDFFWGVVPFSAFSKRITTTKKMAFPVGWAGVLY